MPANTEAYRALIQRLRDLDVVFTPAEADQVRAAADAKLFGDGDMAEAVREALDLLDRMVEAARLSTRTCRELSDRLCEIEPVGVQS
jgi:hypothetical protein